MRVRKRNLGAVLLACALVTGSVLALPACHAPVTIVTPEGQRAYTADQIVVRVNELQNAAIAAERSGGLPTVTTRYIVAFAVSADKTLAATPTGWPATVRQLWLETKVNLLQFAPPITNPAILAAISAVDVVIGVIQP